MKIVVGDQEICLNQKEIAFARSVIDNVISVFQEKAVVEGMSQYFTAIIYMYVKSSKLLDSIGLDNLNHLMQEFNQVKFEDGENF